jgi:hypothetical protein
VFSIIYCMPEHCIHTMEYYKTFHFKGYIKHKYILFITMLPYRITPEHVITLTMNYPNKDNVTACKFQSNIKDICIMNTIRIFFLIFFTVVPCILILSSLFRVQLMQD